MVHAVLIVVMDSDDTLARRVFLSSLEDWAETLLKRINQRVGRAVAEVHIFAHGLNR